MKKMQTQQLHYIHTTQSAGNVERHRESLRQAFFFLDFYFWFLPKIFKIARLRTGDAVKNQKCTSSLTLRFWMTRMISVRIGVSKITGARPWRKKNRTFEEGRRLPPKVLLLPIVFPASIDCDHVCHDYYYLSIFFPPLRSLFSSAKNNVI